MIHSQSVKRVMYNIDNSCDIGSTNNPLIDIFRYFQHLSAGYCIDIIRSNSVSVPYGSEMLSLILPILLHFSLKKRHLLATYLEVKCTSRAERHKMFRLVPILLSIFHG